MNRGNYTNGQWISGSGEQFESSDPSNGERIWQGNSANSEDVSAAFDAAKAAFEGWAQLSLEDRIKPIMRFKEIAITRKDQLGELIARETGKQLWDATGEAGALASKVDISSTAYQDRTGVDVRDTTFGNAMLQHRPHGVMAVLGPYNFPAHLPNGQILPALIAGNTVVFKPSEQTPAVGEALIEMYAEADFPAGVINMVQGARETGAAVLNNPKLDGLLFTGSAKTGAFIHQHFGGRPEIVLALEMGGNNPLIAWDVKDAHAAASIIAQSAFITTGQRCTCARRLILPTGPAGDEIIDALVTFIKRITIGAWDEDAATMGPLISANIAGDVVNAAEALVIAAGATALCPAEITQRGGAFVSPGLYDVTGVQVTDEEIFGPVLTVTRAADWDAAINNANDTRFGLAAGLISDDQQVMGMIFGDGSKRASSTLIAQPPVRQASCRLAGRGPRATTTRVPITRLTFALGRWPAKSPTKSKNFRCKV